MYSMYFHHFKFSA